MFLAPEFIRGLCVNEFGGNENVDGDIDEGVVKYGEIVKGG